MIRILFPLIMLALAVGLFFGFTDPLINKPLEPATPTSAKVSGGIRALMLEKNKLDETLVSARQLSDKLDQLTLEYNNLSPEKLARLDKFLPSSVDNVQLIIDINNIAKTHGMEIRDVKVRTQDPKTQTSVISNSGTMDLGSVGLSFSVTGPYRVFQNFLIDLSRSIRIVDLETATLSIGENPKAAYTYTVELKTYWLK